MCRPPNHSHTISETMERDRHRPPNHSHTISETMEWDRLQFVPNMSNRHLRTWSPTSSQTGVGLQTIATLYLRQWCETGVGFQATATLYPRQWSKTGVGLQTTAKLHPVEPTYKLLSPHTFHFHFSYTNFCQKVILTVPKQYFKGIPWIIYTQDFLFCDSNSDGLLSTLNPLFSLLSMLL